MNLRKKETTSRPLVQEEGNGCNSHTCFAATCSSSHKQRSPTSTPSPAFANIAEDHVALFSSCMLAYENFIGGKLTDPETIEEDFNQVDPDDMEDMDIQWNMAMILRKAKRFLNRTSRKFIDGHSNAKIGFDKSKAKCYKCLNFGHFARECQKDKASASGFTQPSLGSNQHYNNQSFSNNRSQNQGASSNAQISEQQFHLDVAYKELEKKNVEIAKHQNEILKLSGKIEKLRNSRFVVEHYESVVRQVNGICLSTNAIPPPVNGTFVNGPVDIDLSFLDKSSSKDNSSSDEEFYSDECSEDNKVEGVVSEEMIKEPKINKNTVNNSDSLNCTSKNQEKWPAVPKQAVSLKTPPGKQFKTQVSNIVKTTVQYMVKSRFVTKPFTEKWIKKSVVSCVSTHGNTQSYEVKLSRPQRRRQNKSLTKLGQRLTGNQLGKTFLQNDISKPIVQKKQVWRKKLDSSQASNSDSPKGSPIFDHHDCELIEGQPKGSICNRWYVDSGCSRHMTGNMALLRDVKPFRSGYVAFAGEKGGSITSQGGVTNGCISFDNVNYYEQLKHNLLSVSQMCDKEYSVMFNKSECLVLKPGFVIPEEWILIKLI
ncbi:hypothetical protein L1987_68973 [Smallanthus sonchifolius]|uniref:Uncharacterized protein n=1 Tax=Smallanthus sonchifolius TaxID=185202 RepID=A0ACB9B5N7_9ASTR|nr:hypothetical protein L1987_68973 [Smallanthus sonchifolius]